MHHVEALAACYGRTLLFGIDSLIFAAFDWTGVLLPRICMPRRLHMYM